LLSCDPTARAFILLIRSLLRLTNDGRSDSHNLRSTLANSAATKDKSVSSSSCCSHVLCRRPSWIRDRDFLQKKTAICCFVVVVILHKYYVDRYCGSNCITHIRGHSFRIIKQQCRINARLNSFACKCVELIARKCCLVSI